MILHAVYAIACSLVWAGTNIAGKMLPGDTPALTFAFIRYLIALICLFPFVQITEYKKITRRMIPSMMFLGLTAVLIYNAFFFNALHLTSATSVSLISVTNPIITLIISSLIFRRIPTKYQLLAFMLSFTGAVMIITQGRTGREVLSASLGELLALAGVITYVSYTMMLKHLGSNFSPLFLAFVTTLSGLIFLLPFVANYELITTVQTYTLFDWGLFAYLGCLGTAAGLILFTLSVKRRGAELTSLITFSTMPLFVSILSFFMLGDRVTAWQMGGGMLVMAALFIGVKKGSH